MFFAIFSIYALLIFHAKMQQKYTVVLEKKLILLILLCLVTAAILDIRPDPNLHFCDPGVRSCEI